MLHLPYTRLSPVWRLFVGNNKKSFLESIPMLVLLGLLAGAVGGLGLGLFQQRALNSAASTSTAK
jgi:hypothetical protein